MDQTSRERAYALLLEADKTYGVHAGRDAISQALDDDEHGVAFSEWAATHLGEDNLLTPDELAL